jgi:hypothetical protein
VLVRIYTQLALTENRKRRRLSASSAEKPFQQPLKGFKNMIHEKALVMAEVAALRAVKLDLFRREDLWLLTMLKKLFKNVGLGSNQKMLTKIRIQF